MDASLGRAKKKVGERLKEEVTPTFLYLRSLIQEVFEHLRTVQSLPKEEAVALLQSVEKALRQMHEQFFEVMEDTWNQHMRWYLQALQETQNRVMARVNDPVWWTYSGGKLLEGCLFIFCRPFADWLGLPAETEESQKEQNKEPKVEPTTMENRL